MLQKLILTLLLATGFFGFVADPASAQKKTHKDDTPAVSVYDLDALIKPIPLQRRHIHDMIDQLQHNADAGDGNGHDNIIDVGDSALTILITRSILDDIDHIEIMIENLPVADRMQENNVKLNYLNSVYALLDQYVKDAHADQMTYHRAVDILRGLIIARQEGNVMEYVKQHPGMPMLLNLRLLDGYPAARAYVYTVVGQQYPVRMLHRLKEFADDSFSCSIIAAAARIAPIEIYNFVSSTDYKLSNAVRRCQDPLVQAIVRIASESHAPLKAMPFLSDIFYDRKTIAQIDVITADPDLFYKNLVRLKVEGDTLGSKSISDELAYRGIRYVRTMNDLHESSDPVRFKCVEGFTPPELYFLMVYGQDEIYTSTFLGSFNRMKQRMDSTSGDQLLETVHYDKFRTFIRMCAGYNKLAEFLGTIQQAKRADLMRDFVANLERGGEDDLEDAVDVADAYGSIINDTTLAEFLLDEVKKNYRRVSDAHSKKGLIVYGLLATIFNSFLHVQEVDAGNIGLAPVNLCPYANLVNDSGVVIEQFFFYGDEDGKASYASFLADFPGGKWKRTTNKYWTEFTSTSGKPIVVYANLPIEEPGDEEAQAALGKYLADNNIDPTFIIHRGHSYHLSATMSHLNEHSRIVMLGSCGGYHNLGVVLDRSPDAQIISSKQTGAMAVNDAIIPAINDELLAGNDIDWVKIWIGLEKKFTSPQLAIFHEYVPPHKNLGAIFIKAYRRLSNGDEE